MKNSGFNILLALSCTVFYSCTHKPMSSPLQIACKADTITVVSFSREILPILTSNCALSGCHSGAAPKGHLNLEAANAYEQLWQSGSGFIDTENVTSSLLYSQLVSATQPMSPAGKLDTCTIALVRKWIAQKGKNN